MDAHDGVEIITFVVPTTHVKEGRKEPMRIIILKIITMRITILNNNTQ